MGCSVDGRLATSHIRLRCIVGILGIALPFFLAIASFVCADETALRDSISAYYHSSMGNEFIGILCVIGAFLFAYKGYDSLDDWVGHLAGLSAFGVALCPVDAPGVNVNGPIEKIHYASAVLLFLSLIYFSAFLFTKSNVQINPGTPKAKRNMVYKGSALVMGVFLGGIIVWSIAWSESSFPFVFWAESVMLVAFGISWFVKGDTLLRD